MRIARSSVKFLRKVDGKRVIFYRRVNVTRRIIAEHDFRSFDFRRFHNSFGWIARETAQNFALFTALFFPSLQAEAFGRSSGRERILIPERFDFLAAERRRSNRRNPSNESRFSDRVRAFGRKIASRSPVSLSRKQRSLSRKWRKLLI